MKIGASPIPIQRIARCSAPPRLLAVAFEGDRYARRLCDTRAVAIHVSNRLMKPERMYATLEIGNSRWKSALDVEAFRRVPCVGEYIGLDTSEHGDALRIGRVVWRPGGVVQLVLEPPEKRADALAVRMARVPGWQLLCARGAGSGRNAVPPREPAARGAPEPEVT